MLEAEEVEDDLLEDEAIELEEIFVLVLVLLWLLVVVIGAGLGVTAGLLVVIGGATGFAGMASANSQLPVKTPPP